MRAVVLPGDMSVAVQELPDPKPDAGEVVVRVLASAVCGSDMSALRGDPVVGKKPEYLVPGHEVAGVIQSVGDGVTGVAVGDRVAVYLAVGCMRCSYCRSGSIMLCPHATIVGFDRWGGDADLIAVPAVNCMPLPEGLDFVEGALSTDMFGTQFATQDRLAVSGADTVVVSGLGPMGAAAVAVARARGARVIAIDPVEGRRELGLRMGAHEVLSAIDETVEALGSARGRGGPDVVIECSGNAGAQGAALDVVRPFGRVAFVGESRRAEINPSSQFIRKMISVVGAWYFPIHQYDEIADFLVQHRVPVREMVSDRFDLADASRAFEMLAARTADKMVFAS
jgi:propanol-preferring alcohol dehydrogenase